MSKEKYIELLEKENKRLEIEINNLANYKRLFKAAQEKHGICDFQYCLEINCGSDHK